MAIKIINKDDDAYKTIGEVANELSLTGEKSGNIKTHTIRYWETQFKQIKPKIRAGGRRYYSSKNVQVIRYIKFLLKEKGLTINGVKKILDVKKADYIDDDQDLGVYKQASKSTKNIKERLKNISKLIKELKKI